MEERRTVAFDPTISLHELQDRMPEIPTRRMDWLFPSQLSPGQDGVGWAYDTARFGDDYELLGIVFMQDGDWLGRYRRFMPVDGVTAPPLATEGLGNGITHSMRSPLRRTSSGYATAPFTRVTPLSNACLCFSSAGHCLWEGVADIVFDRAISKFGAHHLEQLSPYPSRFLKVNQK